MTLGTWVVLRQRLGDRSLAPPARPAGRLLGARAASRSPWRVLVRVDRPGAARRRTSRTASSSAPATSGSSSHARSSSTRSTASSSSGSSTRTRGRAAPRSSICRCSAGSRTSPISSGATRIERVIVAFSDATSTEELVRSLRDSGRDVSTSFRGSTSSSARAQTSTWSRGCRCSTASRRPAVAALVELVKRVVDIVGAGVLLSLLAPVLRDRRVQIRRESAGPVFFRQPRLG